jgi:hypothetical protein
MLRGNAMRKTNVEIEQEVLLVRKENNYLE